MSFVYATVGRLKLLHQELTEIFLAKVWLMQITAMDPEADASFYFLFAI